MRVVTANVEGRDVASFTEAAKRSQASIVVASIPESDIEIGGQAGREALARLEHTFGRLEAVWKPVGASEGFEIVRRRLFGTIKDEAARDTACREFSRMYAGGDSAAVLLVDPARDLIHVYLLDELEMAELRERDEPIALPADVETTIENWKEMARDAG